MQRLQHWKLNVLELQAVNMKLSAHQVKSLSVHWHGWLLTADVKLFPLMQNDVSFLFLKRRS